ncbi:MAG: hypothetical protein ACKPKO_54275, partial [Candidatus Fonsibacter sp.]
LSTHFNLSLPFFSTLACDVIANPITGDVDRRRLGPIAGHGPLTSANPGGGVIPRILPLIRAAGEGDRDGTITVDVPTVFQLETDDRISIAASSGNMVGTSTIPPNSSSEAFGNSNTGLSVSASTDGSANTALSELDESPPNFAVESCEAATESAIVRALRLITCQRTDVPQRHHNVILSFSQGRLTRSSQSPSKRAGWWEHLTRCCERAAAALWQ